MSDRGGLWARISSFRKRDRTTADGSAIVEQIKESSAAQVAATERASEAQTEATNTGTRVAFVIGVVAVIGVLIAAMTYLRYSESSDDAAPDGEIVIVIPPPGTEAGRENQIVWVGESQLVYASSASPYSTRQDEFTLVLTPGREILLRARDCTEQFRGSYVWTFDPAHELIEVLASEDAEGRVTGCQIGIRAKHQITESDTIVVVLEYPNTAGIVVSDSLDLVLQPVDGLAEVIIVDVSSRMQGDKLHFAQAGILDRVRLMDAETITGGWLAGDSDKVDVCRWSNPVEPNASADAGGDMEALAQSLTTYANTRPDFTHAVIDAVQSLAVHPAFAARPDLNREVRIIILTAGGSNCLSEDGSELLGQEAMSLAQGSDADVWISGYLIGVDTDPEDEEWLSMVDAFRRALETAELAEGYVCEVDGEALRAAADIASPSDPLQGGFTLIRYCG